MVPWFISAKTRSLAATHSGTIRGVAARRPSRCLPMCANQREATPVGGAAALGDAVCSVVIHCRTSGSSSSSISCWTLEGGGVVPASWAARGAARPSW